jgi:hypothetical protein
MVADLVVALLAQVEAPIQAPVKLDPVTRGRLMMALLAIAVMGVGMIVMVILGARMVRRRLRLPPIVHHETPLPPKRILKPRIVSDGTDSQDPLDHEDN